MRIRRRISRGWIGLAAAAALLGPARAYAKKVSIEWKPVKGAVQYELQVEREGKVVVKKTFEDPAWSGDLGSGVYTYQVRAYDRVKRPGRWSEPKALVVMPKPPEAAFPPDGKKVVLYDPKAGTALKWEPIKGVSKYLVDVKRGNATVYSGTVRNPELSLKALPPGDYSWQVTPIVEASGRSPASLQGRRWEGKPSEVAEFTIDHGKLEAPVPVSPVGTVDPPSDKTMKFKWKKVDGAEAYEVEIVTHSRKSRRPADEAEAPSVFITQENSLVAAISDEGKYTWRVRALANFDPNKTPAASSPRSSADFQVDRNASYFEGSGYLALSSMLAPYTYSVVSPGAQVTGSVDSAAITFRLSGEYWLRPQWGVAAAVEDSVFGISNSSYTRKTFELGGKYRIKFGDSKFSWVLSPKAGLEMRDWFEILPAPMNMAISSHTLGPAVGFDLRKQISEKVSLGAKFSYYLPMAISGDSLVGNLTKDASYRNLSVGLQGFYWLNSRWGLGAGAYLEHRSISYQVSPSAYQAVAPGQSVPTSPEEVFMDGTYFFGSVLYSFGH